MKNVTNKKNIAIYRVDGLGIFQNIPKTAIEGMKEGIDKVFKDCAPSISIECNLKSVDFLDVTFDLVKDINKPYPKSKNKPLYLNKHANYPLNILKQLPKSIEKHKSET